MMNIEPKFNNQDDEYYVDIPIDNQTLHMSFWLDDWTDRSVHLGVYLQVYTKRKRIVQEEGSFAITGKNPLATGINARKAFEALERESLNVSGSFAKISAMDCKEHKSSVSVPKQIKSMISS